MKIIKKHFVPILFLIVIFGVLYKIYIPRVNAFGCFDDCLNIMGGYFLSHGNKIYADFYFNHQPGMAYLSFLIFKLFDPSSIAELILRHRQMVYFISFIFSTILYLRFSYKILAAIILYEFSKFYVFGDRFLAEGIVAYIIVYQIGVIWELLTNKKINNRFDIYAMPVASFLVIFLREPYILATLFLFFIYIFLKRNSQAKYEIITSIIIFLSLSFLTIISNSPYEYFYNVLIVNQGIIKSDALNQPIFIKLLTIIFYPFYLIFSASAWTILRSFMAIISFTYISAFFYTLIKLKKIKLVFFYIVILVLVNLRPGPANVQFYEAFNLSVYLFTLILITIFLSNLILSKNKRIGLVLYSLIIFTFLQLIFNRNYFIYEKVKTQDEFFTNYSYIMDIGTTIRNLSDKNDTLFVDGYDDLIIFESKLKSPYKYVWYTSFMPNFKKYTDARNSMFKNNLPDFYYGRCILDKEGKFIENNESFFKSYRQLSRLGERDCISINKNKISKIKASQWEKIDKEKYSLKN